MPSTDSGAKCTTTYSGQVHCGTQPIGEDDFVNLMIDSGECSA